MRLSIGPALYTQVYLVPFLSYLMLNDIMTLKSGCRGVVVAYRTRNREVAGSTHIRSTASNLVQVANLL